MEETPIYTMQHMIAATNHTVSPQVAVALAEAADSLFTTEAIIDASAILNTLLSREDRLALITTFDAAEARLFHRYTLAHPEVVAEVAARELAARILDQMWSNPHDEVLGWAILQSHVLGGNLYALDVDTRRVLETVDANVGLITSALLVTGLSYIISHEARLTKHGDAIREVFSEVCHGEVG